MDAQLKAQCQQIIHVATQSTRNSFGDPSFGAATAVQARVEDDQQEYGDSPDGERRRTRKRIVTESRINMSDRIWLPGDSPADPSLGRSPYQVQELPDERGGIDHYETVV